MPLIIKCSIEITEHKLTPRIPLFYYFIGAKAMPVDEMSAASGLKIEHFTAKIIRLCVRVCVCVFMLYTCVPVSLYVCVCVHEIPSMCVLACLFRVRGAKH